MTGSKRMRIRAKSILVLHCTLLGLAYAGAAKACTAPDLAHAVVFEEIHVPYGDQTALAGGVWRPAPAHEEATPGSPAGSAGLPLVVMSHGGGGSYDGHSDIAIALACAGFVVAAVNHSGDTHDDESRVLELWRRPDQLRRLTAFMLTEWHAHDRIDARRVGAFGFSNGGFTVLVAAGGVPDLDRTEQYCDLHPNHNLCRELAGAGISPNLGIRVPVDAWKRDSRIRAIVVAAPAFGFAFGREGLREIRIPVQIWGGALDRRQPAPWYEDAVAADLPITPEFHRVADAGHYDFLPPCSASLIQAAPVICRSEAGFDRAGFHRRLNRDVVAFFSRHLAVEAP